MLVIHTFPPVTCALLPRGLLHRRLQVPRCLARLHHGGHGVKNTEVNNHQKHNTRVVALPLLFLSVSFTQLAKLVIITA